MKRAEELYSAYSIGCVDVDFVVDSVHQLLLGFDDIGGGFAEQTSQRVCVDRSVIVRLCVSRSEKRYFNCEEERSSTDRLGVVLKNAACNEKTLDVGRSKYLDRAVVDLAMGIAREHFKQLRNEMV